MENALLGNEREVQIYLPPRYDASGDRYLLLVVNHGDQSLLRGHLALRRGRSGLSHGAFWSFTPEVDAGRRVHTPRSAIQRQASLLPAA